MRKGQQTSIYTKEKQRLAALKNANDPIIHERRSLGAKRMWNKTGHREQMVISSTGRKMNSSFCERCRKKQTGVHQAKELVEKRVESTRITMLQKTEQEKQIRAEKIKQAQINSWLSGKRKNRHKVVDGRVIGRFKTGYFVSKKNAKLLWYESSYELVAFTCLENDNTVVSYDRCPFAIPYSSVKKQRLYFPDILVKYINDNEVIIEVKPFALLAFGENSTKFQAAKEFCFQKGLRFVIWTEKELGIGKYAHKVS